MEFITSWQRQGRVEGRAEAALTSRRDTLLEQLQEKFGDVPEKTVQRVQAISSVNDLSRLLRQIIHADSLQEMGLDGTGE